MFGLERIETLISELNTYALLKDDALARHTLVDIYRWIYHSNRGDYKPVTALSPVTTARFPDFAADLASLCPAPSGAQQLGRKGGQVKSDRKTEAARENGKRGGRPRKLI